MGVQSSAERGARAAQANSAVQALARAGYVARGIVYAVVGVLALMLAFGSGGATTGPQGAVQYLAGVPFGEVLLWIVAIGLAGFVLWRLVQTVANPEGHGGDAKGWARRIGHLVSAVLYAALLVGTLRVLLGGGGGGGGNSQAGWTAKLLSAPFGQALVALVGIIVAGYGVYEMLQGWRAKFTRKLRLDGIAAQQGNKIKQVSRFGVMSRGFVWVVMGIFFIQAALTSNPNETGGIGEALASLSNQPFGTILLAVVAAGLVAFAAYSLVLARYRRLGA